MGAAGHFARLRLLDPNRYPDLDGFLAERAEYTGIAQVADKLSCAADLTDEEFAYLDQVFAEYPAAELRQRLQKKALLTELVDRHGTGGVIFTWDALKGFPVREARPVALQPRQELTEAELHTRLLKEFDLEIGAGDVPDTSTSNMGRGSNGWPVCCVRWVMPKY